MATRDWTPAQQNAIDARGGTVLVSAAAGSGKTAVLVERILKRLADPKNPVSPARLLVVTFTKAAAAEMQQRLAKGLDALLQADPTNPHLRRQMLMLPTAHISTTHAFCATLLRDQFHLLGLSPDFKVLEEKQAALLANEALTETMDEAYALGDKEFLLLADSFGSGRSDYEVSSTILRIYNFASSFPFPEEWLDAQVRKAAFDKLDGSDFDKLIRRQIQRHLDKAEYYTRRALSVLDIATPLGEAYIPIFESDLRLCANLREAAEVQPYTALKATIKAAEFVRLASVKKGVDDATKEFTQELRKQAKKAVEAMNKIMETDEAELLKGQELATPVVRALVAAVRRFSDKYREKKDAVHGLDFSDLEHKTIGLLYKEPGVLSEHAAELSANFDEIFVDEYQDTNEVQDAIFHALSRNDENLFYVGDVKQSIYAFRQACPRLFIEQRKRGVPYDGKHYPATVTLGNNFRSRREVTDMVNFTFSLLMREEFGGIEYNDDEKLVCSAAYPPSTDGIYDAELTLIDLDGKRSEQRDIAEARSIAADIERLMQTMRVTDEGKQRPAQYRDFCILLRSKKAHADAYVKELTKRGIPAYSSGGGGFFSTPEVGVVLSLLRFLDNPTLDIPLAALMMSPLYRFTVDDMAKIRMNNRYSSLMAAVQKTARQNGELPERCREFLTQTGRWRTVAPVLTVDRLMERLYDESGITDIYGVQKGGQQRVANLQQLFAMAHSFEENGYRGLSAFVRMCDRMQESGQDIDPATVSGGAVDGVPIISIHHSKGLEFPVVFLAGCAVGFSNEDTKGDLLMHREAGLGLRLHDHNTLLQYDTCNRLAARQRIRDEIDEEELRVLYVAMTRAREKLCIVSADTNIAGKIRNRAIEVAEDERLPVFSLTSASSFEDWLLSVAALHPAGHELREIAGIDGDCVRKTDLPLTVRLTAFAAEEEIEQQPALPEATAADTALVNAWRERLAWRYPYMALKDLPNKLAAAAIAHREQEDDYIATAKPAFLQTGGLSPAERGTAMHQFMQFADYSTAAVSVADERDRLAANGWLTQKQADSLDIARLERFFTSELYRRMANAKRVMRELPFVTERPAAELFPEHGLTGEAASEPIAVQGVADCVFVENDGIVIVDYKTDRVKQAQTLRERYAAQVRIYARAMQDALGLPVKACLLWSFALGCEVEVPVE